MHSAVCGSTLPQPKSATKRIVVIACAGTRRQRIELLDITAADHGVIGLECGNQASYDIGNVAAPFLLAVALESAPTHVILIGGLLVGQVTKLHGLHDAVHNHRRSKPGSETEEQHLSALVAAQRLHGCVVDDLYRVAECGSEIERDPSAAEIAWFGDRSAVDDWAGIADRYHVILPIAGESVDAGHHLPGGHRRPGCK